MFGSIAIVAASVVGHSDILNLPINSGFYEFILDSKMRVLFKKINNGILVYP
jgi:hypothetical protein